MRPEQILEYELLLLLAKHGEQRVLKALAQTLGVSDEDISATLGKLRTISTKSRTKEAKKGTTGALPTLEAISEKDPEKARCLELLLKRFESRDFLPELKDVRRFCERHASSLGPAKSREKSGPHLFRLLTTLDTDELKTLCEDVSQIGFSSLGVISDEIMRR